MIQNISTRSAVILAAACLLVPVANAQFVSFNDHYTGPGTHPNATLWNVFGTVNGAPGNSGPLKNITNGVNLPVILTITTNIGTIAGGGATAGAPTAGTPAYNVFNGFIDFALTGTPSHAIQIPAGASVAHTFTGLDPAKRYSYKATAIRGDATYVNRWSLFELTGALSFSNAHTVDATGVYTNGLNPNQVAIDTGYNSAAGDIMDWENIAPAANGTIVITATQFTGPAPGNGTLGPYAYGIIAERLEEFIVAENPVAIITQPTNTTVVENRRASFTVGASGIPGPTFQWYRGVDPITDATNATYAITTVLADNAAIFTVVANNIASNVAYSVTSSPVTLTVLADTNRPTLVSVVPTTVNQVLLTFSEPVALPGATNPANYTITSANGNLIISNVTLAADQTNLLFATSLQLANNTYKLTVSNVQDLAASPNTIATNSFLTFITRLYNPQDIGSPVPAGSVVSAGNGFDVTGSGSDFGGTSDQFQFSYQQRTGNFDVKARVQNLSTADIWAKAALMAREDLGANTRFAASVATPSLAGCFFEFRGIAGATATNAGTFQVNGAATWLRLSRAANVFTAYAGYDGQTWFQLGSATIALNTTVNVGLAVTGHNTNQISATAQFRDIGDVTTASTTTYLPNPYEVLGPSSRKAGLVLSEIMYKPAARVDTNELEYVELYNSNPFYDDISGWSIAGDIDFTFPAGTVIPAGGFFLIAKSPGSIQNVYGLSTGVFGPYSGSLKKAGTVRLRDKINSIVLEVNYSNLPPWPIGAEGTGHSLALVRPSYGENDPRAWAISDVVGGSPMSVEAYRPSPLRNVVINEILAHTDITNVDYVELYNHSSNSVDISGCILTDDARSNTFIIPASTVLPAAGFISFTEAQLGFFISAEGETLFLKNPDQSRILDAVTFEAQANQIALGRVPDGAGDFYPLASQTPGTNNSGILVRDIVINEIMYDPISLDDNDQYVELYNKGTNTIDLSGWQFTSGISFSFPPSTLMAPDSYLVVAKSAANLIPHYANLNAGNTLGDFGGKLSHKGERLVLSMPDLVIKTNALGVLATNTILVVEDEVTYGTGGRWGKWAAGGGSSLELKDPRSNHRLAYSWDDSDETAKAPWTNIETYAYLDRGLGYTNGPIMWFTVGLQQEGECLIDNVEFRSGTSGGNLITNSTFDGGFSGWTPAGNHYRSTLEVGAGYPDNTGNALHIRSAGQFFTGRNYVQTFLSNSLPTTGTATIRYKARWLKGWTEPIARVNGNWIEATAKMAIPQNLGTPGARNSRAVVNAGPAIYEVTHTPSSPAASQAAVVTARFHDPDGLGALTLNYRVDTTAGVYTYTPVAMNDFGTNGDVVAHDGIYSATIPGQAANVMVAFTITATDGAAVTSKFPSDLANNSPIRECNILFGDGTPITSFGVYRLWISLTNVSLWSNLGDINNEEMDCTFVSGNRVIYNMGARWAGSPYHQNFANPVTSQSHYHFDMPEDDKYLGVTSFNKIHAPGNGAYDDNTLQREQAAYFWVRSIGLPYNYRRFVSLYVNGTRRAPAAGGLMEDTQVPNGDVLEERFPDDKDGDLFKMQPWFEFDTAFTGQSSAFENKSWCVLNAYTTTNPVTLAVSKKPARYRYSWQARGANGTANNFSNVFALIDAASYPANSVQFITNMEAIVDMEQWMRTFAVEHSAGNWDSVGAQNAQNMYCYKPTQGKFNLLIWDYNIILGNAGCWTPGSNVWPVIPTLTGGDAGMLSIYSTPKFQRAYFRALKELANGPMTSTVMDPILDAKYAQFVLNGQNVVSPNSGLKDWIVQARASLLTNIAYNNGNIGFTLTSATNVTVANGFALISGKAPFEAQTILLDGVEYPTTWSSMVDFTIQAPLRLATNVFVLQGYDHYGNILSNIAATITATGPLPQDNIVINEIMYNPLVPDASYIELYNRSTNASFDLSSFRFEELGFGFPSRLVMTNRQFLVIAKNPAVFVATYGSNSVVIGPFTNPLSTNGQTLTLVSEGHGSNPDIIIDKVRYESTQPWSQRANGFGPSLQLIDPAQDNSRVSNWREGGGWKFYSANVKVTAPLNLYLWLLAASNDLYVDNLSLVLGTVAETGTNFISNPGFEAGTNGFRLIGTHTNSVIASNVSLSGNNSLHIFSGSAGGALASSILQTITNISSTNYTFSFWYLPTSNSTAGIKVSFNSSGTNVTVGTSLGQPFNPGLTNSTLAPLPPYPPLWVNEVQPDNTSGITDAFGEHDPWIELYNAGTTNISLDGFYLANTYTNLIQWVFPADAVIAPGEFKVVFADAQPGQTTGGEYHANFRLTGGAGNVVLSRIISTGPQIIDYLNYTNLPSGYAYGDVPDGQPFVRKNMFFVTPGGTNNGTLAPIQIYINEWMASNTRTITNTANGNKADDWFELYNPGSNSVSLEGYYLTHNLNDKTAYLIPSGYSVPAHGFLFVWADQKPNLNTNTQPQLHVSFNLNKSGDAIGLYSPDGLAVDTYSFGAQTSDQSQGRFADGAGAVYFMPTPTPNASNVVPNNQAPVIGVLTNQTINPGQLDTFTILATDSQSPPQILTYSLLQAPPAATIASGTGLFSWTPGPSDSDTTNLVTVVVADNASPSLSATQSFTIVVRSGSVNTPPYFTTAPGQVVLNELTPLSLTVPAADYDVPAQILTYSLLAGPGAMGINASSGALGWTPTEADGPGTNVVIVVVTDNGTPSMSATQSFTVIVNEVNSTPVLAAISDKTINELATLSVTNSVTDGDVPVNHFTYSLVSGPSNASVNATSGIFTWTPNEGQGPGTNLIVIKVADDGTPVLSSTQSFTVVVQEVNTAPVFTNAPGVITVPELVLLSITNQAVDGDLPTNRLTFELLSGPSGSSLDTNSGVFTWTPTEAQGPSSNAIVVRVFDNGSPNLSATQTLTVLITEANSAPTLATILDQTIDELTLLSINLSASASDSDVPANTLSFGLVSGPPGMSVDGVTGVLTWTPTEAQGPSSNPVMVRVFDNGTPSLSSTQSFTITVREVNTAPTLAAVANRTIHAGGSVLITNVASDADLPANVLTFFLEPGGAAGANVNASTGVFSWTTTTNQVPGTNVFTVRVSDNGSPSLGATQSFNIVVVAPLGIGSPAQLPNGHVVFSWNTIPGKSYRVLYKNTIDDSTWNQLGSDIPATGNTLSQEITPTDPDKRFYKITIVD